MTESGYSSGYSSDEFDCDQYFKSELVRFKRSFKVLSLMIKSANGTLYNGINRATKKTVVIKNIPKKSKNLVWMKNNDRRVPAEIKFHQIATSASKQAVELIDFFEQKNTFIMILEKPENSIDLLEFVNTYGALDFEIAKQIVKSVATSCYEFQAAGISHRDIKDENILFNPSTGDIKIIDFGCATKSDSTQASGTLAYFPPEMKSNSDIDIESATVYSLGCLLYTLLTGSSPFSSESDFDFTKNITLNSSLSSQERKLLSKLLNPISANRPTLVDL